MNRWGKSWISLELALTCARVSHWPLWTFEITATKRETGKVGFLGPLANPGRATCFQMCKGLTHFSKVIKQMYGVSGVFLTVSRPDSHHHVYIQAGNRPQTCWNPLHPGLVLLLPNSGSGHVGLASCGFSNFWFETSHLIVKTQAWMEYLSPVPAGSRHAVLLASQR